MHLTIGISADATRVPRVRRKFDSPLHGVVPLDGLTLTIGANSSGKTALLENIEQTIEHGWQPRPDRRLYRPQRAQRRLYLQLDMRPGSSDLDWLASLDPLLDDLDDSTLARVARQRREELPEAIGRLTRTGLISFSHLLENQGVDDAAEDLYEDPALAIEALVAIAKQGRFVLEVDTEGFAALYLDPRGQPERLARLLPGSAFAFPSDDQREAVLPPVVLVSAEAADVSALAERCISALTGRWFGVSPAAAFEDPTDLPPRHPWIVQDETNQPLLALGARATARELQAATNRLLPPFIAAEGRLRLEVLEPERWTTGRTVVAGFGEGRSFRRVETSGSGTRRWIALCLELATAALMHRGFREVEQDRSLMDSPALRELWGRGFREHDLGPSRRPKPLLLFDEPELHLHPLAQREAGAWLGRRLLEDDVHCIVSATHSPTLLGATTSATRVLSLRRETTVELLHQPRLAPPRRRLKRHQTRRPRSHRRVEHPDELVDQRPTIPTHERHLHHRRPLESDSLHDR